MTRTLAVMWQSLVNRLPVYSRREVDRNWCDGFSEGCKSAGIARGNDGRFVSIKHVGRQVPIGTTRRLAL